MLKLKDIESRIEHKYPCHCWRSDENPQILCVRCCAVGENFYDYGEQCPEEIDYSRFPQLKDDPRIYIVMCEECCCCAGW